MSADSPIKALLISIGDDPAAAVYSINRLKPDNLCFFLTDAAKPLVETAVQPHIQQMPRRWDWVVTPDPNRFAVSYQVLARGLPELLRAWEVTYGELVLDMTGATPAMAAAMALAGVSFTSRMIAIERPEQLIAGEGEQIQVNDAARVWLQVNPWDEASAVSRREASDLFNRGAFTAAITLFRHIEGRVSGGQKPLYHALADLADGYGLWERFQYRQAWEKIKAALKALDMASVWGGPPGLKALLPALKQNAGFLEKLVLDPQEVKEALGLDLLAHARRRADVDHHLEAATVALLRSLEAFAQHQLFKRYRIKPWDVQPEQLPETLREPCRTCWLDDVDGKYKLPLYGQFRALAGLGDQMGQAYLAQWSKMKPFLDAAEHGVLRHGFETIKAERFQQLYDVVIKISGVSDMSLPKFPILNL
jgi:CRISPR-associated protein (TIGR02710 family)